MSTAENHAENLKRAIGLSKKIPKAAKGIKDAFKASSLSNYINPIIDMPFFGIALSAALLKDILDFTGLGSLPAIGTVITLIASITIAASILLIARSNIGAVKRETRFVSGFALKRVGALFGGTLLEMIFGIDFLPVETLMVIYIFRLVLLERKATSEASQRTSAQENYALA